MVSIYSFVDVKWPEDLRKDTPSYYRSWQEQAYIWKIITFYLKKYALFSSNSLKILKKSVKFDIKSLKMFDINSEKSYIVTLW